MMIRDVSGDVQIKSADGVSMPLHEQAVSVLSLCAIGVVLVSGHLLSGVATTQNILRQFSGVRAKGLALLCAETAGSRFDHHHTVHVGGNKKRFLAVACLEAVHDSFGI